MTTLQHRPPAMRDRPRSLGRGPVATEGREVPDGYPPGYDLCEDVVENMLRRMLWIDPLTVKAAVHDGVVTLTGTLDRRSTAEIALHVTKSVPGVIRVVDDLTWEYDDTNVTATTEL